MVALTLTSVIGAPVGLSPTTVPSLVSLHIDRPPLAENVRDAGENVLGSVLPVALSS